MDGISYTWDANGNLLHDGVRTYAYDHANRLTSVSGPTYTTSYRYNGLGDRLEETVNGVTTRFTLDLAAGLTQVLADGTNTYLYGYSRIAQYGANGPEYFLGDALGSVRQVVDSSGMVTLAKSYEPYGEGLSSVGSDTSSYGFSGEWTDSYIELVYLRSRMYSPGTGRFLTKDSWRGDYNRPLSLNGWNYVEANPINFVDPSGFTPYEPPEEAHNHRDLTRWLYSELFTNANGYYAQTLKGLNSSIWTLDRGRAFAGWTYLVKDKAKWDFKHKIQDEMGRSVLLRFPGGYEWIEYSVPGNIHYGFVGRASGFSGTLLHMGAGYAEITDPAHANQGESCCPEICMVGHIGPMPFGYCKNIGCYYMNSEWIPNLFDDPADYNSVEFGVKLFNAFGSSPTYVQFENFLASHVSELTKAPNIFDWKWINPQAGWPYQVGRFDGPDTQINANKVSLFLGGSGE